MFHVTILLCMIVAQVRAQNCSEHGPVYLNVSGSTFSSPYYPENYTNSLACEYTVIAPEGSSIIVTFQDFDIEDGWECGYDALVVYDGPLTEDNVLAKLCGSLMPRPVFSNHNLMLMRFTSDGSVAAPGFKGQVTFKKVKQPYHYNFSGAYFTSPNYPENYESLDRTEYRATAAQGEYIIVTFHSFNIQSSTRCHKDSVQIFDGNSTEANVLATLCGSPQRQTFFSSGYEILITFTTDQNGTYSGFEGVFIFREEYCPVYLNESESTFTSPYYPQPYTNSLACEYTVKAPEGSRIIVTFQDFDIERSFECRSDSIVVYDGPSIKDNVLAKLCGSSTPTPVFSNQNLMLMKFTSNEEFVRTGFQGRVTFKKAIQPHYYNFSGAYFTSPNYPENYENLDKTVYRVTAAHGQYIAVTFHSFNVQYSTNCSKDSVKIFDGNSTEANVLATLCGSLQRQTFFSSGYKILITFTTDQNGTYSGFEGVITFHEDSCSGTINSNGSVITSPNFPQKYGNFVKCDFVMKTTDGNKIEIVFSDFELETTESCIGDSVEIFDGGTISEFPSVKLCGSNLPPPFISSSNFVTIRFKSDEHFTGSGFRMHANFIIGLCWTCDYLHRYYRECPEHSVPPTAYDQERLDQLPPSEYLRCRTLTGETSESYRGDHYWMISDCPKNTDTILMTRCRGMETPPIKTFTPLVLSGSLNVLFKNEFCAICNNVSRDDFQMISVYSTCQQCPGQHEIHEGDEIEVEPMLCQIRPDRDLPRKCSPVDHEDNVVCPVLNDVLDDLTQRFITTLFKNVVFSGPQCSEDRLFLNGACIEISTYCEQSSTTSLLSLNVDPLNYECSYLKERSEECFFQEMLSYQRKLQNDIILPIDVHSSGAHIEHLSTTFSKPWGKAVRPVWWTTSENQQIFFHVPKNLTSKLNWKQHFVSAIMSFLHDMNVSDGNAATKACYLNSIELLELCLFNQVVESDLSCHGNVEEIPIDVNSLHATNITINAWRSNATSQNRILWYGYKTSFGLFSNYTKSQILCLETTKETPERDIPYIVVTNVCSVITVVTLVLTFVVYVTTPSLWNNFGTVMITFLLTFVLGLISIQFINPYVSHIKWLCEILAVLTHWLWLSVFTWMSILAFDLHNTFNMSNMCVVNKIYRKRLMRYFAIGWGFPTLLVSVCVIVWRSTSVPLFYGSHEGRPCWIYENVAAAVVVTAPLVICLIINLLLFIMIIRGILAHRASSRRAHLHEGQTKGHISELILTIKISVLMGFTWISGFIAPLTNINGFNYLFYLLILLQGIFIFVFFGASKRVRKLWRKKLEKSYSSQSSSKSMPKTQTSDV